MCSRTESGYWEHFEHQADIGIRGLGNTKEQAFEQAAVALTAVITDPNNVSPEEKIQIHCRAPDDELLLAEWLNCLLYEMAVRKMLFCRFEVKIEKGRLTATASGQKIDIKRHRPAVEVKAATYTSLSVKAGKNGNWVAQCVVDV